MTIDCTLLNQLLEAEGPIAFDRLRLTSRDQSPAAVRQALQTLQQAGCRIDNHPQHGVQLREAGLGVWADLLEHQRPGRSVEVYRQTASTQEVARRMIASRGWSAHGCVAIADAQSAGRGRLGRRWLAPPGTAALFSRVTLVPRRNNTGTPPPGVDHLTLIAAVGVARGIEAACRNAVRVQIKWPNDLLIDNRKLAGILVEAHQAQIDGQAVHAAITGIGINVTLDASQIPAELQRTGRDVISLHMAGAHVDRLRVLTHVLAALDIAERESDQSLLSEWRQRCAMLSQRVELRNNGRVIRGQVIDLDPHEGLIVRTDAGAITHLPAATTSRE